MKSGNWQARERSHDARFYSAGYSTPLCLGVLVEMVD
jgi:hypothetical protein